MKSGTEEISINLSNRISERINLSTVELTHDGSSDDTNVMELINPQLSVVNTITPISPTLIGAQSSTLSEEQISNLIEKVQNVLNTSDSLNDERILKNLLLNAHEDQDRDPENSDTFDKLKRIIKSAIRKEEKTEKILNEYKLSEQNSKSKKDENINTNVFFPFDNIQPMFELENHLLCPNLDFYDKNSMNLMSDMIVQNVIFDHTPFGANGRHRRQVDVLRDDLGGFNSVEENACDIMEDLFAAVAVWQPMAKEQH